MDKEERQNLKKSVHRMESIVFILPPSRELTGLVGGEWKRGQDWRRSLVRSRGKFKLLEDLVSKLRSHGILTLNQACSMSSQRETLWKNLEDLGLDEGLRVEWGE